eukprot:scaffold16780_cov192-Skeletonema_marinoi.AAC.1
MAILAPKITRICDRYDPKQAAAVPYYRGVPRTVPPGGRSSPHHPTLRSRHVHDVCYGWMCSRGAGVAKVSNQICELSQSGRLQANFLLLYHGMKDRRRQWNIIPKYVLSLLSRFFLYILLLLCSPVLTLSKKSYIKGRVNEVNAISHNQPFIGLPQPPSTSQSIME